MIANQVVLGCIDIPDSANLCFSRLDGAASGLQMSEVSVVNLLWLIHLLSFRCFYNNVLPSMLLGFVQMPVLG